LTSRFIDSIRQRPARTGKESGRKVVTSENYLALTQAAKKSKRLKERRASTDLRATGPKLHV